jgi:transposase-like protein
MPEEFSEFHRDVIAVFPINEGATIAQIAKDFEISESRLQHWLKDDDIWAGRQSGGTVAVSADLREVKKSIRMLEQEKEVLLGAAVYLGDVNPT